MSLLIYIRDQSEYDHSLAIDYDMYESMIKYKNKELQKDLIFLVSDVKEGFHKDFFDSLHIYDYHLPAVSMHNFNKYSCYY